MTMKKERVVQTAVVLWVLLCMSLGLSQGVQEGISEGAQRKEIKGGAGERGVEATVVEGAPIRSDQLLTKDHPEYARGMVCVECHHVTFDAVTTSTKMFTMNYPQLPNDEIWKRIEALLPGRERFVLTTVYNNEPTATTVDMVLDKNKKVLYVLCEKGTEKLMHIRQNPRVCAVHYKGWTLAEAKLNGKAKQEWLSVQIRGTAEVITSSNPEFGNLIERYKPVRVTPTRAALRFDVVRITPTSAIYFNTNLFEEKVGIYQRWEAKK